jgi:ABC-type nitrate/sulfonate/bicarbonate transport system permease component
MARARLTADPILLLRAATLVGLLALWQIVSWSGLLYRGVIPSLPDIARATISLILSGEFYHHLLITSWEVLGALVIGGGLGILAGLGLGASRFAARGFEPYVHYLAPTPKIVFLPVFLVAFGTGPASKLALAAVSAFFPMALSVATGVRGIDPVLLRVGRSFRLKRWQKLRMIYLPALVRPVSIGLRLAFGLAMVGALLSEISLSNAGLGYLAAQDYGHFQIPAMYAVLIVVFALAATGNAAIVRLVRPRGARS